MAEKKSRRQRMSAVLPKAIAFALDVVAGIIGSIIATAVVRLLGW